VVVQIFFRFQQWEIFFDARSTFDKRFISPQQYKNKRWVAQRSQRKEKGKNT